MSLPPAPSSPLRLLLIAFLSLTFSAIRVNAAAATAEVATDLILVQQALDEGEDAMAERLLQRILQEDARNPLAHRLNGVVLLRNGSREGAEAAFATGLALDPRDELTREYLFSLYYNDAQELLDRPVDATQGSRLSSQARAALLRALEIRPESVMSAYLLATLEFRERRYAETISLLLGVAARIPDPLKNNVHGLLYSSAVNLLNQKRSQEANGVVDYLANLPQAPVNDLLLAASIALENGDNQRALTLCERILQIDPAQQKAQHNRTLARQRLDNLRRAQAGSAGDQVQPTSTEKTGPAGISATDAPRNEDGT